MRPGGPPDPPRRALSRFALLALLPLPVITGCGGAGGGGSPGSPGAALLEEVTERWGIAVDPAPWPDGRYRIPELSPGGVAIFDYDADGDLDIYQVCAPPPDRPQAPAPNRLFRQDRPGEFVEVPGAAGLDDKGYGNGVAVGDIDGDGDLDVYVCNLGPDALYLNDGRGGFTGATSRSGISGGEWSSSAAFLDYDRDGDLDLYVTHYLHDEPDRVCRPGIDAPRDYCGPSRYQGVADTLYRNRGDGTFEDVSRSAGLVHEWPGFGISCADFTGDGWVDIYVANDMQPNQLYVNRQDGAFREMAFELGAAVSGDGKAQAGMGVAVGDADGDGRLDLFVTNLADQTSTLYLAAAQPGGGFLDRSGSSGLGGPTLGSTAWGCAFLDLDHDGDLDLAAVDGRVARGPVLPGAALGTFWSPYGEPAQLFLNSGGGRFTEVFREGGEFTARIESVRALAIGDLDGDGDLDIVTAGIANRLRVFRNVAPKDGRHWLRVRALARGAARRDALGALVAVVAGGKRQVRPLISASSFQSASEPVAHFGLGAAAGVEAIDVLWPDGRGERFGPSPADRVVTLIQGEGKPAGEAPR